MGLIDADLTRDEVSQYITTWKCKDCLKGGGEQFVMAVDDIAYLPIVDAEPVKHGHWIIIDDVEKFLAKCSECGRVEDTRLIKDYPYCHCGAKMDGGVDDDDKQTSS